MPLTHELLTKLQQLRQIPEHMLTVGEKRLLDDLEHRHGVSGVEDAIAAGGPDPGDVDAGESIGIPRCPKCHTRDVQGRSTPRGVIWKCLNPDCRNSWRSSCGPTLQGAITPQPAPNPSVHRTHNDYYPSGGANYRHPLMNHEPED